MSQAIFKGRFWWLVPGCVLALSLAGCNAEQQISETSVSDTRAGVIVQVAPVQKRTISTQIDLIGNLLPRRRTVIVAEVDGVIKNIPAATKNPTVVEFGGHKRTLPLDIGSEIGEGDVLVELDDGDFQRSLALAKAKLEATKAKLDDLLAWRRPEEVRRVESLYIEAKANLDRTEKEFKRAQSLVGNNAISRAEFDLRESDWLKAKAVLAVTQANLDIAKAGPTQTEIAVAQATLRVAEAEVNQKQWKVDKCTILAPYDGVVTDRWVDVGDRVTALPRVEILEIMDVSYLVAEVGVPERFADTIRASDPAQVLLEGVSAAIPGRVARVNDKIDPGSRTFRIRVAIRNDERKYHVGQLARTLITIDSAANALAVPRQAITYRGGVPQVFVFDGHRVEHRVVRLGQTNEEVTEILDGLQDGEQVVTDDPAILTDGMLVQGAQDRVATNLRRTPE